MRRDASGPRESPVWRLYDIVCEVAGLGIGVAASAMATRASLRPAQVRREWRGDALAATANALGGQTVVVHAVSLGELNAAMALVRAMHAAAPGTSIVVTVGTADARDVAGRLARSGDAALAAVSLLPWDGATRHGRWLDRVRPAGVVLVETELWPGLLRACASRRCPVAIVNGRIDERAARRYRRIARWMREPLGAVRWCGAIDDVAARRLETSGVPAAAIEVVGDLKQDAPALSTLGAEEATRWGVSSGVLLGASTHPGEEALILDAWPDGRVVLAPRHRERARHLAREVAGRGRRVHLWSDGPSADWEILVVDRPGWLAGLYAWATAAVLGGTFFGDGGHNPWEAVRVGCPLVVGPRMSTTTRLRVEALAGDALRCCAASELRVTLQDVMGREPAAPRPRQSLIADSPVAAVYAQRTLASFAALRPAGPSTGRRGGA